MSEDHVIHLGDCLDPLRGLASLADKSVDHVICDPPYEAEAHTLQRRIKRDGGRAIREEPVPFAAIDEGTRTAAASEIVRVSRGWVIVFCQAEAIFHWRRELEAAGAHWRRPLVWVKPDGQPCLVGDRPGMGYESMAAAWAGDPPSRWNSGGKCGVYRHNKSTSAGNVHPTQKPVALLEELISDFTDPGELICDPFAGSGTTGVACKRLGRRFIGWEKDATFWERAVRRLENTKQQYELLPRGPKPKQQKMVLP